MQRRVPIVTRDDVAPEFRDAYDEITSIRGHAPVQGPTSVMIHSPKMALLANRLSEYLEQISDMPDRLKELAMCIAARSMDCQFIWNAHAAGGRRVGLSDGIIDGIRDKKPLPDGPEDEVVMANYGLELTRTNHVSQETFQAALDILGAQQLTEFTTLIGYYRMSSLNVNGFTIDLPEKRTEPLLPV